MIGALSLVSGFTACKEREFNDSDSSSKNFLSPATEEQQKKTFLEHLSRHAVLFRDSKQATLCVGLWVHPARIIGHDVCSSYVRKNAGTIVVGGATIPFTDSTASEFSGDKLGLLGLKTWSTSEVLPPATRGSFHQLSTTFEQAGAFPENLSFAVMDPSGQWEFVPCSSFSDRSGHFIGGMKCERNDIPPGSPLISKRIRKNLIKKDIVEFVIIGLKLEWAQDKVLTGQKVPDHSAVFQDKDVDYLKSQAAALDPRKPDDER
jgi:hypothetical protein